MNGHIKILWNPTRGQLRQFGLTALVALPALAWLWSRGSGSIVLAAALAVAAIAALGFVWPQGLRPLFVGLSLLAWPIGVVVHELCLLVIYYVVFVPLGLVFRCMGRDPLQRKFERGAATYWQAKRQPGSAASYFRRW